MKEGRKVHEGRLRAVTRTRYHVKVKEGRVQMLRKGRTVKEGNRGSAEGRKSRKEGRTS